MLLIEAILEAGWDRHNFETGLHVNKGKEVNSTHKRTTPN